MGVLAQVPVPVPPQVILTLLAWLAGAAASAGRGPAGFDWRLLLDVDTYFRAAVHIIEAPIRIPAQAAQRVWDMLTEPAPPLPAEFVQAAQAASVEITTYRRELEARAGAVEQVISPRVAARRTRVQELAGDVARLGVWQEAHSGLVHGRIAREWPDHVASQTAFAAAVGGMMADLPDAVDRVLNVDIPTAVDMVIDMLRETAERLKARDVRLGERIDTVADRTGERIQGVVELLTDRVVPDLRSLIDRERAGRVAGDRDITDVRIPEAVRVPAAEATRALTWTAAVGVAASSVGLASTKVLRTEPVFDLLLRGLTPWLGLLLVPDGLRRLVVEVLGQTAEGATGLLRQMEGLADALTG